MTSIVVNAKDLGLRYSTDDFAVSESFDLKLSFSYLNYSPLLPNIDSGALDKSYLIEINLDP